MTRLFTILASLNILALLASFTGGTLLKLGEPGRSQDVAYLIHFTLGLSAALITLLVHCLIFTYFLGTGRWVKEVGIAYALPDAPLPKRTRLLKRKTFPPALAAMLVTIAVAAAGAAARTQEWPWAVHAGLAVCALLVNLAAFRIEHRNLQANALVIDQVLLEVDRIRAERGLPSNAEALAAENVGKG